jgi:hypothetical protein
VESKLGPLGTAAIYCPIVPAPGDCEDGELFGGMKFVLGDMLKAAIYPRPLCNADLLFSISVIFYFINLFSISGEASEVLFCKIKKNNVFCL